jgi:hypothetical protein
MISVPAPHDPMGALERITDRRLSPLAPIFVAMSSTWTAGIGPERVLRSLVLMAFFDLGDETLLCREIRARSSFRRFLNMEREDPGGVDPIALRQGLDRLVNNQNTREFLGGVVTAARNAGLMADEAFTPSEALIRLWTAEPPGAARFGEAAPVADR